MKVQTRTILYIVAKSRKYKLYFKHTHKTDNNKKIYEKVVKEKKNYNRINSCNLMFTLSEQNTCIDLGGQRLKNEKFLYLSIEYLYKVS